MLDSGDLDWWDKLQGHTQSESGAASYFLGGGWLCSGGLAMFLFWRDGICFFCGGRRLSMFRGGLAIIMCFPKSYAFFVMPFLTEIK